MFYPKNVAMQFHLLKKLTSCLFCNICVILKWPWLSRILPCDGLTGFVLLQSSFYFFSHFLTLSTIPSIMGWKFLVSAWSLNDSAEIEWETARPFLDTTQFLPQTTFRISWFLYRNEGLQHSSAIARKSCHSGLSVIVLLSAGVWASWQKSHTGFLLSHHSCILKTPDGISELCARKPL